MFYDKLLLETQALGIDIIHMPFKGTSKGYYASGTIVINENILTDTEKCCVLAEELGHYCTTSGNILSCICDTYNQESRARNWAYEKLVPLTSLIEGHQNGCKNRYELAEYLNVTEEFLDSALSHYAQKYGPSVKLGNHVIHFDSLNIERLKSSYKVLN